METTDYRKLAENMEVIMAVLKKTSCDIAELSNMFIWMGVIFLLKQAASIVLSSVYVNTAPFPLAAGEYGRIRSVWFMVSAIFFLGEIIVFLFYFIKCRKKKNKSSIYLMKMWGILLFLLLPALAFLYQYIDRRISSGVRGAVDLLMLHHISFSADITYLLFYPQILAQCITALLILFGIYIVGAFSYNKRLKADKRRILDGAE